MLKVDKKVLKKHLKLCKEDLKKFPNDKFLQHQIEITEKLLKQMD